MDIELIFKVAGVGIIVSVLNILLKKAERDEQALMTTLAGLVVVLMLMISEIGELFETVRETFGI
ncbi:MAG: stage III sporulation protein AC [Huintestinicola sp.]|uniref:stage III sporulation protein AC n=1 Tax=Huintestinicola sp. TaxID=2981661 RepID=UPI003D7C6CA3